MADQTTSQPNTATPSPSVVPTSTTPVVEQVQAAAPVSTPAPAPAVPAAAGPAADADEKFFAALGYVAFLFVIPLLVKPKSDYCKFHARQSMVMFLMWIVGLVFLFTVTWFGSLLNIGFIALYVLAMYRAYIGEMWNIPVIGALASKIDLGGLYGKAGLAVTGISGLKEKAETLANKAGEAAKNLGSQEEKKPEAPTSTPAAPTEQTPPPTPPSAK